MITLELNVKRRVLALGLGLVLLIGCTSEKKADQTIDSASRVSEPASKSLDFHYDSVKVYAKNPVSSDARVTDTAKAVISYPVFKDPQINQFIENKTIVSDNPDLSYKSYREFAENFINGFDEFQQENKDRIQTWFLDIRTEVLGQKPGYVSFIREYTNFSGGAHPNYVHSYMNYDTHNHREIVLDSLLLPGSMPKLNAIAERIFRKNEKLEAATPLKGKYFFENDTFRLNNNFTITDQGLKFLYNPYEIKAYVYGIIELVIPFSELKDIARPNSLLSNTN